MLVSCKSATGLRQTLQTFVFCKGRFLDNIEFLFSHHFHMYYICFSSAVIFISVVIFVLFQYIGILFYNKIQQYCKLVIIPMSIVLWLFM